MRLIAIMGALFVGSAARLFAAGADTHVHSGQSASGPCTSCSASSSGARSCLLEWRPQSATRRSRDPPRPKPIETGDPVHGTAASGQSGFDRLIYERVRLGIMSALATNEELTFNELKSLFNASDGNLGAHARKLEEAGYVACTKSFEARRPKSIYKITVGRAQGAAALSRAHRGRDQGDATSPTLGYLFHIMHVAIIMDGNGRWATERGLPRSAGSRRRRQGRAQGGRGRGQLAGSTRSRSTPSPPPTGPAPDRGIGADAALRSIPVHRDAPMRGAIHPPQRDRTPRPAERQSLRSIEQSERLSAAGSGMHLRIAIDSSAQFSIVEAARRASAATPISPPTASSVCCTKSIIARIPRATSIC